MSMSNDAGCEAVESTCDQVTPDSNQDVSLGSMRYKDLQLIAISLNLPGNLKHNKLVDLIKARRARREVEVERILAEHRSNRKIFSKRPKYPSSRDAIVVSHTTPSSSCPRGRYDLYELQRLQQQQTLLTNATSDPTEDGRYARRGAGGEVHQHRKKHKTSSPRGGGQETASSVESGPSNPPDNNGSYASRLFNPYGYALQQKAIAAAGQSILASYLNNGGTASSMSNDWRYNTRDGYGLVSGMQVASGPIPYHQTEGDGYKNIITQYLNPNYVAPHDNERTSQSTNFSNEEQSYSSSQSQISRENSFVPTYTNQQFLAYANQMPLSYPNVQQTGYSHLQLPVSHSSSSYAGDNSSYVGYQLGMDTTDEKAGAVCMKKGILSQGYGQNYISNHDISNRGNNINSADNFVQSTRTNSYPTQSLVPVIHKEANFSKERDSANMSSTNTGMSSNYSKYPAYGGGNALWHYQGVPLNYNGAGQSPSNVAHDLTVSSRHNQQEGSFSGMVPGTTDSHASITQNFPPTVNHSTQSAVLPLPPTATRYTQNQSDLYKSVSEDTSKHPMDTSCQIANYLPMTEKNYVSKAPLSAQQERHMNLDEVPSNNGSNGDASVSYPIKDVDQSIETIDSDVADEPECCLGNSFNTAPNTADNKDTTMAYYDDGSVSSIPNQQNQYSCSGSSVATLPSYPCATSSPLNSSSCSGCDSAKCPQYSMPYQAPVSQNVTQSSVTQNNPYSVNQEVNYGYSQTHQPVQYTTSQSYSYPQYTPQMSILELTSPNEANNGYYQEQAPEENTQNMYTSQQSLESMWSSVRAPSPELDTALMTQSPKENELDMQQVSCEGEGVFPDSGDLDISDDQSLSFPSIYDYVMGSSDDPGVGLELKGSKESSVADDSPSPGTLCVVEEEEIIANNEVSDSEKSVTKSEKGDADSGFGEKESSKHEIVNKDPSEEKQSSEVTESLIESKEPSGKSEVSTEKPNEKKSKASKVVLKRKVKKNREKSALMGRGKGHSLYHKRRMSKDFSPARKIRNRAKGNVPRDQLKCLVGKGDCKWIGRIPALASHVRSAHGDSIVTEEDTSFIIEMKDLNETQHVAFFQEAGGVLYLISIHKKGVHLYTTLQSLPGSARVGSLSNGTKASLEVLLKNGTSRGWRGRVWNLVAPANLNNQKHLPHNSASLQQRLWSRGDYLSVNLSSVCCSGSDSFCLYVSITPPDGSHGETSIIKKCQQATVSNISNQSSSTETEGFMDSSLTDKSGSTSPDLETLSLPEVNSADKSKDILPNTTESDNLSNSAPS